jgi:hypothetical protein
MHPPDLRPQALKREHGAGIADMAIGDPGLDGEDIEAHARRTFAIAGQTLWPAARLGSIAGLRGRC